MDRFFTETTFTNAALAHLRGDDDAPSEPTWQLCQSCGAECADLVPCAWDTALMVGPCCEWPEEPECNCTQTDVDLFDARGCDFHDSRSEFNRGWRAAEEAAAKRALSEEPACECTSDGGDLFDPRDCEVHNSASPWNHRLAAIETRGERATKGAA